MRARTQLAVALALVACKDPHASTGAKSSATDAQAHPPAEPCEVVDARGGHGTIDLSNFHDPVARLVLSQGCPDNFAGVGAALDARDTSDCDDDGFSPVRTTLLSERAQLRGTPEGSLDECAQAPIAIFRGVVQRNCGGRPPYGLFASLAPLATVQDELPALVEMIGFDSKAQVFRFYTRENDRWHYFGDSLDMLDGPDPAGARRCAACHVGGGLVMKELDAPWMHWEGRMTTPGVQTILSKYDALGSRTHGAVTDFRPAGKELEDAIVAGNRAWMRTRIEHQRRHATLRRLLRPLFCDEEFNLRSAAQSPSPPTATGGEPGRFELPVGGFLASVRLVGPETLPIAVEDYHRAIVAAGQRIGTFCDKPLLTDDGKTVIDTQFDFAYPHRSSIDELAVDALIADGIVDEAFVRAVLAVDMTRPVFSLARCGLLDLVPELPREQREPAAITAAVLASLQAQTSPAAVQLRENLGPESRDPTARLSAMVLACTQRPPAALVVDLHAYASQLRRKARATPVIELPEVLPIDELVDAPDLHFDLATCTLVGRP